MPSTRLASLQLPAQLNGLTVEVELRSIIGSGEGVVQRDHLEFRDGQVSSRLLSAQGFSSAAYHLTPQDDGTSLWETMQTNADGAILSWAGSWDGRVMHGVVSRQEPGQAVVEFHFVGAPVAGHATSEI
jgi:hypothetical protein